MADRRPPWRRVLFIMEALAAAALMLFALLGDHIAWLASLI